MNQLTIDFQPGLLEQFPSFADCLRASVYGCGKPFKSVAADLDMSVSELSRKLADNPADNVNFPLRLLPDLLRATGDPRPVHWLVAQFLNDPEADRARALRELAALAPVMTALATKAGLLDRADSKPLRPVAA